jgi:hypothetical protein
VIAALGLVSFVVYLYEPNVRDAVTALDLADRQLFAHAVDAADSEEKPKVRAPFGAYIRPVLIATDRRLVLARARSRPGKTDRREFELAWEILYADIRSFSTWNTAGEYPRGFWKAFGDFLADRPDPKEVIAVQARHREITYELVPVEGRALAAILKHRLREACTEPPRRRCSE